MSLVSCNFSRGKGKKETEERSSEGWDSGAGVSPASSKGGKENKESKCESLVFILCCVSLFEGTKLCTVLSYGTY